MARQACFICSTSSLPEAPTLTVTRSKTRYTAACCTSFGRASQVSPATNEAKFSKGAFTFSIIFSFYS